MVPGEAWISRMAELLFKAFNEAKSLLTKLNHDHPSQSKVLEDEVAVGHQGMNDFEMCIPGERKPHQVSLGQGLTLRTLHQSAFVRVPALPSPTDASFCFVFFCKCPTHLNLLSYRT